MYSGKGKSPETMDPNPPPYPGNSEEVPTYQIPNFQDATSHSKTPVAATSRFPPTFNCYYKWTWKDVYYLGPSSSETLFTLSFDTKFFTTKETLYLHHGPTNKAPIIATAVRKSMGWHDNAKISVHSDYGADHETSFERPRGSSWRQSEFRAFYSKNPKGALEEFQWRSSHGDEIKQVAGRSSGWKLLRMAEQRHQSGTGFSSDGYEVVAVLAHSTSLSMSKGYTFAFLGTGLTGTLGPEWETAAAISGFWLWWFALTNTAGSASSSSASAGAAAAAASG